MTDLAPVTCAAGTDLTETFVPGAGDRYYLVAATVRRAEGALGAPPRGWRAYPPPTPAGPGRPLASVMWPAS